MQGCCSPWKIRPKCSNPDAIPLAKHCSWLLSKKQGCLGSQRNSKVRAASCLPDWYVQCQPKARGFSAGCCNFILVGFDIWFCMQLGISHRRRLGYISASFVNFLFFVCRHQEKSNRPGESSRASRWFGSTCQRKSGVNGKHTALSFYRQWISF